MTREYTELRRDQAKKIMPLIGPLLDAWDALPNDIRTDEEMENLSEILDKINAWYYKPGGKP